MCGGACKDMAVPDRPPVLKAFAHEKNGADRVDRAPGRQQNDCRQGRAMDERLDRQDDDPAKRQVERRRDDVLYGRQEELAENAERREAPYGDRHAPAPGAVQKLRRKRRIAGRDHQKDAGVV